MPTSSAALAAAFVDPASAETSKVTTEDADVGKGASAGEPDLEKMSEEDKKKKLAEMEAMKAKEAEAAAAAKKADEGEVKESVADNSVVLAAIDELKKSFAEALAGVKGELLKTAGELTVSIATVAEQAKKTDAALKGTVFAEVGNDPDKVRKAESTGGAPPLLDTAYSRRDAA